MSVPEKAATLRAFIVKRFTLVPPVPKKAAALQDAAPEKAATLRAFIVKRFTLVPPQTQRRLRRCRMLQTCMPEK